MIRMRGNNSYPLFFLRMVILLRMMVTYTRTCYAFTDFSYIIKKIVDLVLMSSSHVYLNCEISRLHYGVILYLMNIITFSYTCTDMVKGDRIIKGFTTKA